MKNILDSQNEKISEKAFSHHLIISVVSILLCIVVLCSVTYAWFSQEADVGNHIITSGNFSLDVSVSTINSETSLADAVAVEQLSDGSMRCILEKKNTTYTILLSMTEEANVKGYCAISIGDDINEITSPMSKDPEIGVDNLSFTITTAEENTTVCFTPKWGYPASSTIVDDTAIVLNGGSTDDGEYIISILGDSISTYEGYISEGNATYYPTNYLKSVNDTWWMQLITELNAKLGVNESWSGSFVSAVSGARVPMSSVERIAKLDDNGTPDVIVFFGGTNDIAFGQDRPVGSFDPNSAPILADLSATEWESFVDGYVEAILRMKYYYPDTEIIAVLPTLNKSYYNIETLEEYNSITRAICQHYEVKYVDLVAEGFTTSMLGDATHPNASGMDFITATVKKVMLGEHTHNYTASVKAPTCGHQGYTSYVCECGDSYAQDYVPATGEHVYEAGKCIVCEVPAPDYYKDKTISILGDSLSTFQGYITEGNATYFPKDTIKTVDDTWWMQLITDLGAKLGANESLSGSYVSTKSGAKLPMVSVDRIKNLGANSVPDVILFFGGTNDIAFDRPIGAFNTSTAPTDADLSQTEWETLADAYVETILRMKYYYPNTEIITILPTLNKTYYNATELEEYNSVLRKICDHYNIKYVDLVAEGFTTAMLGDATHPNASGMDFITNAVKETMQSVPTVLSQDSDEATEDLAGIN